MPWTRPLRALTRPGVAVALCLATAGVAGAVEFPRHGLVAFGAGRCGFRASPVAAHASFTYHHRPVVAFVRPSAGFQATTRGDRFFFAGLSFDFEPVARWGLTPLLTAGYYDRNNGMNLGGAFEFRSGLEIYRRLGSRSRIGVSIHHTSNAGLFDRNPGRESLFLSYSILR